MGTLPLRTRAGLDNILTQAAQPTSGRVDITNFQQDYKSNRYRIDIKLTGARIPVTDAAGSGSSGSLKLFDFVQQAVNILGCRQDYTAFAEGSALTGAAGDAAFVMGLGTAAADAGDAALTSTEVDVGSVTGTITLSSGTGTGTKMSGALGAVDGTGTAKSVYLNWSGSAATIDANSTIDVWGTITIEFSFLGDD